MASKYPRPDIEKTYIALRYPDSHKWRDLDAAMAKGGYWPNGETVRISDPEMQPSMDELLDDLKNDPEKARSFLQNIGLHKPSESK